MRILVLGAGGTGGYFGGRLAESGADVTFLVRERRAAQLAEQGLRIESPFGDATLQVRTVTSGQIDAPYDLILLSCKAYHLEDALWDIGPAVGENTAILPLLNGLAQIDRMTTRFGEAPVLGGLCHLAVTLKEDGLVSHMSKLHRVTFGEMDGTKSPRAGAIEALFQDANFDSKYSLNIREDMWKKLVMLASLAGMTSLMRASTGAIAQTERGRDYTLVILKECMDIAAGEGFDLGQKFQDSVIGFLTDQGAVQTSSMLRDIERGGPVEHDHIIGDLVARGDRLGIETPMLDIVFCHLQAYVAAREAQGGTT
jgi:2-dehydropantoate 2-reductase